MEFVVGTLYAKKNSLEKQNMYGKKQKMTLARKYCIHGGHWKRTLRVGQAGRRGAQPHWRA